MPAVLKVTIVLRGDVEREAYYHAASAAGVRMPSYVAAAATGIAGNVLWSDPIDPSDCHLGSTSVAPHHNGG